MRALNKFSLILLIVLSGITTAHGQEFPISSYFVIDTDSDVLSNWNLQKSKNFDNAKAAGLNSIHAITRLYTAPAPTGFADGPACSARSLEILNEAQTRGLQVELNHLYNLRTTSMVQRHKVQVENSLYPLPFPLGTTGDPFRQGEDPDYNQIQEVGFEVKLGTPDTDIDNDGITQIQIHELIANPSSPSPKIVFADAHPIKKTMNRRYPSDLNGRWSNPSTNHSNTYFLSCRLKVLHGGSITGRPVIDLRMVDAESGALIQSQTFHDTDFLNPNIYVLATTNAALTQKISYNPEAPVHTSDHSINPGPLGLIEVDDLSNKEYTVDVDYQIYWHDEVDIRVDWVAMDDERGLDLFENNVYDAQIKATAKEFNDHPALRSFYLFDEPFLKHLESYNKINQLLIEAAQENNVDFSQGKGLASTAFISEFRGDDYYRSNLIANPYAYYIGSESYLVRFSAIQDSDPNPSTSPYNSALRNRLGKLTDKHTQGTKTAVFDNQKDYYFYSQIGKINTRDPYLAEVWLQINMAIARGAKGISYFLYPTNPSTTALNGLVQSRNSSAPYDPVLTNQHGQASWDNIINVNNYIKTLGPTILKLNWDESFSSNSWVSNTVLNNFNTDDIQIGLFTHQDTGERYFMLVNRQAREPTPVDPTIADDTQTFTVELTSSSSRRLIEDIYASRTDGNTSAFYTLDASENTFQITLGPGKAKLFRITDGLNGTLPAEEYYLSGEVYLNGDLLVADKEKLIVEPNTLIGTAKTTSTTNYGNYATVPEIVAEFDARLDIQNATIERYNGATGLWGGILISSALGNPSAKPSGGPDTNIKIQNTIIEDAEIGIYISSSSVDEKKYDLSDNTIEDCEIGVKVLNLDENPVELDITDNTIKNCDIGIEMQGSEGSIVDNTIWGGDFGITCSISSSPRIKGNIVHTLTESGLYCVNNSSPLVHTNTASPSIAGGENSFYSCDRGVLAENNSFPYLGEVTFDNSLDGKNYIFNNVVDIDNDTGTFLYINAIYNYWSNVPGANVPPDSTRGLVNFTPWLSVPDPTTKSGKQNKHSASDSLYLAALAEEQGGNLSVALTTYRSIVSIYPDSKTSQSAISGIVRTLKAEDNADQITPELNSIITTHSGFQASNFARQQIIPVLTQEGSFTEATTHVTYLLTHYSGTDFEQYVLFDQLFLVESQAGGGQAKSELKEQFILIEEKVGELENSALKRYMSIKMATQTGALTKEQVPNNILLARNYPNPFNPETTIEYQLPKEGIVKIEIFNLLGQKVRTLVNTAQSAGINQVRWDSRNDGGETVASGIYLYLIQAGGQVETGKMFLLK